MREPLDANADWLFDDIFPLRESSTLVEERAFFLFQFVKGMIPKRDKELLNCEVTKVLVEMIVELNPGKSILECVLDILRKKLFDLAFILVGGISFSTLPELSLKEHIQHPRTAFFELVVEVSSYYSTVAAHTPKVGLKLLDQDVNWEASATVPEFENRFRHRIRGLSVGDASFALELVFPVPGTANELILKRVVTGSGRHQRFTTSSFEEKREGWIERVGF